MSKTLDYSKWVMGSGPQGAKLMLVGEAPGRAEEEQGRPFVGPSGELVQEMIEGVGLTRDSVYITNVVKVRPPGNDLERLGELGYQVEDFLPLLWKEIEAVQPNCILALGALALETLTGEKGIRNYRGSILPCHNFNIKVVPTIHPAALFERKRTDASQQGMFTWKQKAHIAFDFQKAKAQSAFPEFRLPQRNLRVIRSSQALYEFFKSYQGYNKAWVDTEVYKALLVCIGIAFSRYEAISVPLIDLQSDSNPKGIASHELREMWDMIAEFLAGPVMKVGQNFKADKLYWLEPAGFTVNNFGYDTMMKFHTLSPELPKSLAFQASILTDEPFWKSEGREYNPFKDRMDVLCLYNAKDCALNCECDEEMDKDLDELKLRSFFEQFVIASTPIYEHIEVRGLRLDLEKKRELSLHYGEILAEKTKVADELIGFSANYNSPKQIRSLLFDILKFPRRASVDDDALTLLKEKTKDARKKAILTSIQERRTIHKLKSTYIDAREDPDGRMRCSYNQVGTETGRTSTSIIKSPLRNVKWGVPFQTIPKHGEFGHDIRSMFIPDEGKIFMEFDQSQAEARIVALLAEDYNLLRMFDERDVHKWTAAPIFGLDETLPKEILEPMIDDEQRQVGKMGRHAMGYDAQPETLAIKAQISIYRARKAFEAVHKLSPKIKDVFHEGIQQALAENHKILWTPFGRRREFFERWGRELFKEAYAHIPQSTVGDNTKRAMIGVRQAATWIEILIESHDAFTCQVDEDRILECYEIVKTIFEQPIDFSRCSLPRDPIVIPVDCKLGYDWKNMTKFKGV